MDITIPMELIITAIGGLYGLHIIMLREISKLNARISYIEGWMKIVAKSGDCMTNKCREELKEFENTRMVGVKVATT